MPPHKKGINKNKSWYAFNAKMQNQLQAKEEEIQDMEKLKAEKIAKLREERAQDRTKNLQIQALQGQLADAKEGDTNKNEVEELLAKKKRLEFMTAAVPGEELTKKKDEEEADENKGEDGEKKLKAGTSTSGDANKDSGVMTGKVSREEAAAARKSKDAMEKAKFDPFAKIRKAEDDYVAAVARQRQQQQQEPQAPAAPPPATGGASVASGVAPSTVAAAPSTGQPNKAKLLAAIAAMKKY